MVSSLDIFGKALMAYCHGDIEPIYIHRDDGIRDCDYLDDYFSEYSDWPKYEREALNYVRGMVLDVGCGAGRHSLWLQENGFNVVAVDISPEVAKVARLRGVRNCVTMSALNLGFKPNFFDTILLMGNNFGIAGSVKATEEFMKALYDISKEEGWGNRYKPRPNCNS